MDKKKTRIAFIYKASDPFWTGRHFDNTFYEFLVRAMQRNRDVDYTLVPVSSEYDAGRSLRGRCDAVILAAFRDYNMPRIHGLKSLNVPVLSRCGDFHDVRRYGMGERNYDDYGIDCLFSFMSESDFYKYYPRHMNYRTIFFGVEPSLYQNLTPFKHRIKDKILNSGATARVYQNITPTKHRIVDRVINFAAVTPGAIRWKIAGGACLSYARDVLRNPEGLPLRSRLLHPRPPLYHFYKLRTDCNRLAYVAYGRDYTSYQRMLSEYRAAIAATTPYPTIKYLEIAAAGCLAFMEITEKNHGQYLGFKDGESCVVINEDNHEKRFEEYLNNSDDQKWEKMADAGRSHALRNFSNDKGVEDLLRLIRDLS